MEPLERIGRTDPPVSSEAATLAHQGRTPTSTPHKYRVIPDRTLQISMLLAGQSPWATSPADIPPILALIPMSELLPHEVERPQEEHTIIIPHNNHVPNKSYGFSAQARTLNPRKWRPAQPSMAWVLE